MRCPGGGALWATDAQRAPGAKRHEVPRGAPWATEDVTRANPGKLTATCSVGLFSRGIWGAEALQHIADTLLRLESGPCSVLEGLRDA